MNLKNFHLNSQVKYIITGLLSGTVIIFFIAVISVNNIQNKLDKNYTEFAQLITKTAAMATSDIQHTYNTNLPEILRHRYTEFIENNDDISFIEYKDINNNIIYSTKNNELSKDDKTTVNVSSPVILNDRVTGSVTLGLTGNEVKLISASAKKT